MAKLGWVQAALIGVAGNAPTYSVAVSAAALAAAAGVGAPFAIFVCGLITLGILFAYARLNAEQPSAGAAYAWVGTHLHPAAGFFAGWCVMMSSLIFMISATWSDRIKSDPDYHTDGTMATGPQLTGLRTTT